MQFDVEGCVLTPEDQLRARHRMFRRGGAAILNDQVAVVAHTEADFIIVVLTVTPDKDVHAGSYTGDVIIADPRTKSFTQPVTITFQYNSLPLLAVWGVLALGVGTFLVMSGGSNPFKPGDSVLKMITKVMVATAAAGGAFYLTYWEDPSWGSDSWQWFSLAGVMISAYMASLTTANAVAKPVSNRTTRLDSSSSAT